MIAEALIHAVACALLAIEVAAGCHCAVWSATPHGSRCTAPLDYPRCELIADWHFAGPGVPVCSKGNCE